MRLVKLSPNIFQIKDASAKFKRQYRSTYYCYINRILIGTSHIIEGSTMVFTYLSSTSYKIRNKNILNKATPIQEKEDIDTKLILKSRKDLRAVLPFVIKTEFDGKSDISELIKTKLSKFKPTVEEMMMKIFSAKSDQLSLLDLDEVTDENICKEIDLSNYDIEFSHKGKFEMELTYQLENIYNKKKIIVHNFGCMSDHELSERLKRAGASFKIDQKGLYITLEEFNKGGPWPLWTVFC